MSLFILLPLDILLVVAALITYRNRPRIGGQLARGLRHLLLGMLMLGMAPPTALLLLALLNLGLVEQAIVQRLLVVGAYLFFIRGMILMRRAFEA